MNFKYIVGTHVIAYSTNYTFFMVNHNRRITLAVYFTIDPDSILGAIVFTISAAFTAFNICY